MTDDRQRYAHPFRCKSCGGRFQVVRFTADPDKVKTPKCPRKSCGGKAKQSFMEDVGMDVAAGKAPGVVGSVPVLAYDASMKIAMEDHQLTDIQDHHRAGEATAPKLRPDLQAKADGFWGGNQQKPRTRTAKVDMSPIYGERATGGAPPGARFSADSAPAVMPILTSKPEGSSPIPKYVDVGARQ